MVTRRRWEGAEGDLEKRERDLEEVGGKRENESGRRDEMRKRTRDG